MTRLRLMLTLGAALAGAGPLAAQATVERPVSRVVKGLVMDSIGERAVGGAVLYFEGRRDEFHTDSYGRFLINEVGPADTMLVVRRIGYVPRRVNVPYPATGVGVTLDAVYIRPVATRLDVVAVEAEEINRYPQLASFYRRKQAGVTGSFVTRDEIVRTGARQMSDVLRRTARIEMDCSQQQVGDDRCAPRNRRGRNIIRVPRPATATTGRRPNFAPVSPEDSGGIDFALDRCEMEVYVDGMRSSLKIDEIPVGWVAGIEVYSGLATTPPEYGLGRCGVVGVWTTRAGG